MLRLIFSILNNDIKLSDNYLKLARNRFLSTALLQTDSYNQLYRSLIPFVSLSECEDIINYKKLLELSKDDNSITEEYLNAKKQRMKNVWEKRYKEYRKSPISIYIFLLLRNTILTTSV